MEQGSDRREQLVKRGSYEYLLDAVISGNAVDFSHLGPYAFNQPFRIYSDISNRKLGPEIPQNKLPYCLLPAKDQEICIAGIE